MLSHSLSSGYYTRLWFSCIIDDEGGRKVFRDFLRCEYSEENILFWLACEDLKNESDANVIEEKCRVIYEDYISILSPKEVCPSLPLIILYHLLPLIMIVFVSRKTISLTMSSQISFVEIKRITYKVDVTERMKWGFSSCFVFSLFCVHLKIDCHVRSTDSKRLLSFSSFSSTLFLALSWCFLFFISWWCCWMTWCLPSCSCLDVLHPLPKSWSSSSFLHLLSWNQWRTKSMTRTSSLLDFLLCAYRSALTLGFGKSSTRIWWILQRKRL